MWLFSSKKSAYQPANRQIKISTNSSKNDTYNTLSSPSTKFIYDSRAESESSRNTGNGDDSTILEIQNSSSPLSKPLDIRMLSAVTSPGFTSRIVSNHAGMSPLRDMNVPNIDTLSLNVLRGGPHGHLKLGEKPSPHTVRPAIGPRNSKRLSASPFMSNSQTKSWLFTSHRPKSPDNITTFIKIAPIEAKSFLSSSPHPPISNETPSSPTALASQKMIGLGGNPQSPLLSKYGRLMPSANLATEKNLRIPTSSQSPTSNDIMNLQMMGNRKRVRVESPIKSPLSSGANNTPLNPYSPPGGDEIGKNSKRVKFLSHTGQEKKLLVPLSSLDHMNMNSTDDMMMSTESILEQLNQTEKRFLPQDDSPPRNNPEKRQKGLNAPVPISLNNSSQHFQRKRPSNSTVKLLEEEDDPRKKSGRFCQCNECYAELAGSLENAKKTPAKTQKTVTFSVIEDNKINSNKKSKKDSLCDKGTATESSFEDIKSTFREKAKEGLVDLEKYFSDKRKRVERFKRLLSLEFGNDSTDSSMTANENITQSVAESLSTPERSIFVAPTTTTTTTTTTSIPTPIPSFGISPQFKLPEPTATTSFGSGINIPTITTAVSPTTPLTSISTTFSSLPTPKPDETQQQPAAVTTTGGFNFGPSSTSIPAVKIPTPSIVSSPPQTQISTPTTTSASVPSTTASLFNFGPTAQQQTSPQSGGFSFGPSSNNTMPSPVADAGKDFGVVPTSPPSIFGLNNSFKTDQTVAATATTSASNTFAGFGSTTASQFGLSSQFKLPEQTATTTSSNFGFGITTTAVSTATPPTSISTTFSSFSMPKPETQQQPAAVTTTGGFNFGPSSTSTPALKISTPSIVSSQISSPVTISSLPTTSAPSTTALAFQFGQIAQQQTSSQTGFSFGTSNNTIAPMGGDAAGKSLFGVTSITSPPSIFGSNTSFKTDQSTSTTTSASTFGGFGGGSSSTTISPPLAPFGSNNSNVPAFGAPSSTALNQTQQKPAEGGFSFGTNPTTIASSNAFQFGQIHQAQQPAQGLGFSKPAEPQQQPGSFSFGNPSNNAMGGDAGKSLFGVSNPSPPSIFGSNNSFKTDQTVTTSAPGPNFNFGGGSISTASPFGSTNNSTVPTFANSGSVPTFGSPANSTQPQQQQQSGFSFGQPQAAGGAGIFQFGNQAQQQQQAAQGGGGGFNFAPQQPNFAPQTNFAAAGQMGGGNLPQMFNLGATPPQSASSFANRRRDRNRRHR